MSASDGRKIAATLAGFLCLLLSTPTASAFVVSERGKFAPPLVEKRPSRTTRPPRFVALAAAAANPEEAGKLMEQAEKLRSEVESFEQQKRKAEDEERRVAEEEAAAKEEDRIRYSAVVPILKPDGRVQEERVDFPPFRERGTSYITVCEADLPLGIILGESDEFAGAVGVDEVAEGGNGNAAGVRVGDLVRAFTACRMQMEQPAWQLIGGGIGRPKTFRLMYSPDGRPFEEVMDAIGSNRMDPEGRPVVLVLERREGEE